MPEIIKKLMYHDIQYFIGKPEISDTEYDKLRREAQAQFPDDDYFKSVGVKPKDRKTQLPYVLGSLNKVKSDTVVDWMRKTSDWYIISEKIDGVSIYVVYVDGEVEWASTRGDGYNGQDITEKAKGFCPEWKDDGVWMLRGEATLTIDPKILDYKTKRNGCAGILNRDGMKHNEHVVSYFYEVIEAPPEFDDHMKTELGRWSLLERFTHNLPRYYSMPIKKVMPDDYIFTVLSNLYTTAKARDYDVDGLVITVNESVREDVEYPEKKIAFKVNEEAVEATVVGIEWQVSRTGRIVPVVLIKPLEIQGVTIQRVTGHNYQYVAANSIKEGTKIGIVRSGDVIPYITEVLTKKDGLFSQCELCPSCGSVPRVKGVDLVCENEHCGAKVNQRLEHWIRSLGAVGITAKTLVKLNIETIPGLYGLDEFALMEIDGIGPKKAEKIVSEIQKTLHTNDAKLLRAMAIPGIGRTASKALVDHFGSIKAVLEAWEGELQEVDGVGEVLARNVKNWQARCLMLLVTLKRLGLKLETVNRDTSISGIVFTMTGKLPMKRDMIVQAIEANGGIWKNSVTKKTDYLITNNPNSTSGKAKKAAKYGTKVIDWDEFERMLG